MRNYVLAGLVVLTGIYAYFGVFKKEQTENEVRSLEARLVPWSVEDLTSVELKTPSAHVVLERDARGWVFKAPFADRADLSAVEVWLKSLLGSQRKTVVFSKGEEFDVERFGFNAPETTMVFQNKNGEALLLEVGTLKAFDKDLYVRENQGPVFTAGVDLENQLRRQPFELRDRRVWRVKDPLASGVNLSSQANTWRLDKHEGLRWDLEGHDENSPPVSTFEVDQYLVSLHNLRLLEVVSESKSAEDLKRYGLDRPDVKLEVSLGAEEKPLTFTLSDQSKEPGDNLVYVTSSELDFIGRVYTSALESLNVSREQFFSRDEAFVAIPSYQVAKMEIEGPTRLTFEKGEDGEWLPAHGFSSNAIKSLLFKIKALRFHHYLTQAPRGSRDSAVTLRSTSGEIIFRMTWPTVSGDDVEEEVFAVVEPLGYLGVFRPSDFKDFLSFLEGDEKSRENDEESEQGESALSPQ